MPLHPLAEEFASVASAYERGRPDYPAAAVEALSAELTLAPGARVLDLGAGTGKLSRALLAAGLDVVAVEPQDTLREILIEKIGAERVHEGVAEAIPLADRSVAAVTVADAFHWFDQAAALAEIRRVLRPDGGLAIVTMVPDWGGSSWAHELGTLIVGLRKAHPHFDGPPWQQAIRDAGGFMEPSEVTIRSVYAATPERVADYVTSMSWIAALPEQQRAQTIAQVRAIIDAGETPAELPVHISLGLAICEPAS